MQTQRKFGEIRNRNLQILKIIQLSGKEFNFFHLFISFLDIYFLPSNVFKQTGSLLSALTKGIS